MAQTAVAEPYEIYYHRKVEAIITAYSSEIKQTDEEPFIMANGERVYWGAVACPRDIPFGTKIIGLGEVFTCTDRMNMRYADNMHHYDIWMDDVQKAKEWGVNKVTLYLVYE